MLNPAWIRILSVQQTSFNGTRNYSWSMANDNEGVEASSNLATDCRDQSHFHRTSCFRPFILPPLPSWFLPHVSDPYKIIYGLVDREMTAENQGFNLNSIDSGCFQGSIVTIPILCEAHSLPNDRVSRSLSQSCQFARWHRSVLNITLNGLAMPAVLPCRQSLPSQTHEYPGNKEIIQV